MLTSKCWIYKITKKKMLIKSKTFCIEFLAVSILLGLFSWLGGRAVNRSESTKQMEQRLRAKVKIFFKSENLKKCF